MHLESSSRPRIVNTGDDGETVSCWLENERWNKSQQCNEPDGNTRDVLTRDSCSLRRFSEVKGESGVVLVTPLGQAQKRETNSRSETEKKETRYKSEILTKNTRTKTEPLRDISLTQTGQPLWSVRNSPHQSFTQF